MVKQKYYRIETKISKFLNFQLDLVLKGKNEENKKLYFIKELFFLSDHPVQCPFFIFLKMFSCDFLSKLIAVFIKEIRPYLFHYYADKIFKEFRCKQVMYDVG